MLKHLFFVAVVLVLAGCWDADLRHTLYLESNGEVAWQLQVTELEVPEEPGEVERRLNELWLGTDSISETLFEMGALSVETTVLREKAPLSYVFQARFASIGPVLEALFEEVPELSWREEWTKQGRTLSFQLSDEIGDQTRADFPVVELIGAEAGLVSGTEPSKLLRLSTPEDWAAIKIQWREPQ